MKCTPICDHVWTGTRDQLISALPQIISSHRTAQLISIRIVVPLLSGAAALSWRCVDVEWVRGARGVSAGNFLTPRWYARGYSARRAGSTAHAWRSKKEYVAWIWWCSRIIRATLSETGNREREPGTHGMKPSHLASFPIELTGIQH